MELQIAHDPQTEMRLKARRGLVWLGVVSITMLFAGLTSAYIVRQGEGKWVEFALPGSFWLSTILIVLSSVPMQWAVRSAVSGNQKHLLIALSLTLILGLGFAVSQYFSWSELFRNGIAFAGRIRDIKTEFQYIPANKETLADVPDAGNVAGSFLYVITGLHLLHLLGGIFALLFVISRAVRKRYSSTNYNGVSICAIYWHFLDGLWVYLFFFLLYIR